MNGVAILRKQWFKEGGRCAVDSSHTALTFGAFEEVLNKCLKLK